MIKQERNLDDQAMDLVCYHKHRLPKGTVAVWHDGKETHTAMSLEEADKLEREGRTVIYCDGFEPLNDYD